MLAGSGELIMKLLLLMVKFFGQQNDNQVVESGFKTYKAQMKLLEYIQMERCQLFSDPSVVISGPEILNIIRYT